MTREERKDRALLRACLPRRVKRRPWKAPSPLYQLQVIKLTDMDQVLLAVAEHKRKKARA